MAESSRLSSRLRELLRNSSTPGAARDRVRPLDARDLPSEAAGETRYVPDEAVTVAAVEAPQLVGEKACHRHRRIGGQNDGVASCGHHGEVELSLLRSERARDQAQVDGSVGSRAHSAP